MKHRHAGIVLLFLVFTLFYHCSEKKNSLVGLDVLQRDNVGSELHKVFQAASSDTFFQGDIPTGKGNYLYFGKYGTIEAKTLMRFNTLSIHNPVDSLVLFLNSIKIYRQTGGGFTITVAAVSKEWNEETITWNTFDSGFIGSMICSKTVFDSAGSTMLTLPTEWAASLADSSQSASCFGIVIDTDNADGLVQTTSRESSISAQLRIYHSQKWDTVTTVQDAFITTTSQAPDPNRLFVADGALLRCALRFNTAEIPKYATIGRALLKLHVDNSISFPAVQSQFAVRAFALKDSLWSPSFIPVDSTNYIETVAKNDTVVFNITSFVQQWASGITKNNGVLLSGKYAANDLAGLAFYSSGADTLHRPSLDIFYTLPPSSSF